MRCIKQSILIAFVVLGLWSHALADGVLTPAASTGGALPSGGTVNDCILNTAPGTGTWQACPGAAGGDNVSVNGGATVNPDLATTGSDLTLTNTANVITFTLKSGLTVTNWTMVNPALGTPASGVATNLTGTATGLTAGVAQTGDSATSFFSSGTLEDARLPTSMADKVFTGSLQVPNGAAPTTDAFGEIAGDNDAWAASRGALQHFDGTANTFLIGVLASDLPANGECPKWNTGGTITWETCAGAGSMATDTLWDAAGDLAYGTGSNTAARLAPGTANQLLRMNSGATAPEWTSTVTSLTSIDFGANPADSGRLRLSNNESICWELNTPGVDKCLFLNASDEFELNAPLNLTGTAGALLQTGVVSPSAPAGAEQWYFYADSVDNLPKYIYNGESEQTFYTTANPQTTITGNAGTATALASNPTDCSANQFANAIAASGNLTCAAIADADVPDTITVSNYLPLSGGTLTGSLVTDNLGIEFEDSDTNPTCGVGEFKLFADLSEVKFKKCMNGNITDMDTTGGTPSFDTITGGTNTTAAMIVGTGGSLAVSGSGTIAATTAAALAVNGGNCSAGSYPLGVDTQGAVESCTAIAGSEIGAATATTPSANDNDTSVATTAYVQTELTAYASDTKTLTNTTLDAEGTGNVITIPRRLWFPGAGCNNATAGSIWDLPTSNPAVAACKTGTNTQMGVLDFADSANLSAQLTYMLPATWVGNVDARVYWLTSATTGDVVWQIAIACAGDADTDDPAFTDDVFTADTAKGTTLQLNITASNTVTTTGACTADDLAHIRIKRDSAHASDSLAATARLVGVELVIREAM